MVFPKRIPEPMVMGKIEQKAFGKASLENYTRWFIPLVDEILENSRLRKGKIADIACGPGLLVKEIAHRSTQWNIVGIDTSQYVLQLAKRNCRDLSSVSFKKASVYSLPFKGESFDIVVCKDSLHHFNNLKQALREMWRILKRGGLLYLQDLRRDLPRYLLQQATPPKTIFEKLQFYSTRASYTKEEIKRILNDMKINNYRIRTRKLTASLKRHYRKEGIDMQELKESFQSRYVAILKKE